MQPKTTQKIKVGIFASATVMLLLIGIFLIGRNKNMFRSTFLLYGTFKNVGGLQAGNNIRFVGINVGTVESVEILSDTTARVALRLQEKVQDYIKKGAVASISSDGLMGDKLITIASGVGTTEHVKDGDEIKTNEPLQFDKVMDRISGVADNAMVITDQLAGIATQVNHGKGSIGRLLYSDSLAKSMESTVSEANSTMKSVHKGAEGFSDNMEALKHNFLLRGYFKKKQKAQEEKKEEQQEQAQKDQKDKKQKAKDTKRKGAKSDSASLKLEPEN
jgi:phospholipid/cholesterol/gamma-HCH transport system substrate-binding protein